MQTNKISITRNYLLYVLLAVALFFLYRTIFRYGCSNLSNTFICQLTLFFSILVYITIRPSKQFLVSYIPITLLYLLIPVWEFMCGHKIAAHEFLASFLLGSFFYFSVLYLKLILGKYIKTKVGKFFTYLCDFVYLCFFFYAFSFYLYYLANDGILQGDVILAIAQTNLAEAITYIDSTFSEGKIILLSILIIIAFTLGGVLACAFHRVHSCNNELSRHDSIIRTILGIFIVFFMIIMTQGTLVHTAKGYDCQAKKVLAFSVYMTKTYGDFVKNRTDITKSIKFSDNFFMDEDKGVYVLVIGESANRDHLSLYGYKYDTTPLLNRRIKEKEQGYRFIWFRNAYSSFTHTIQSVTNALTDHNQYNGQDLSRSVSIIDIANKAGFDTYWISNQSSDSMIVTPITSISMSAGSVKFVSESKKGGKIYDLDILDNLPAELRTDRDSFIVIHLMGSHTKYRDRYPPEFSRFSNEQNIINEYDNSIYYTDYVLDNFFRYFSQKTNLKFFGYISDHGADPTQMGNDHNTTHFVFDMVRIPFIISFSEKYAQSHQKIVETLAKRVNGYFTNDLIFDLLLSVMGLSASNYYDSSFDLSSENYSLNQENAKTLLGEKKISEDHR